MRAAREGRGSCNTGRLRGGSVGVVGVVGAVCLGQRHQALVDGGPRCLLIRGPDILDTPEPHYIISHNVISVHSIFNVL